MLLGVAESISAHQDLRDLCRDLAQRLPRVVHVNFVGLSLHDPERNVMQLHTVQANVPADLLGGHEEPVEETPAGMVWHTQQPIIVPDLAEEPRWPKVLQRMQEDGINSCCFVPLTTSLRRLGALGFSSLQKSAYDEADVEFLRQVGNQVAVAVDNVIHHQALTRDRDRLRLLLEVSESIASHHVLEELFQDLAQRLPHIVPFNFINAVLHEPARNAMRLWLLVTSQPTTISPGLETPVDESPGGLVWKTQQPLSVDDVEQERRFPGLMKLFRENGVGSFCVVPLTTAQRRLGAMGFGSLQKRAYQEADINFMRQVAKQVAVAVDNALHAQSARSAQQQLEQERDRQRLLLEVNNAVVSRLSLSDLFKAVSGCLRTVIQHDGSTLVLCDPDTQRYRAHVLDFTTAAEFIEEGQVSSDCKCPSERAFTTRQPVIYRRRDLELLAVESDMTRQLLDQGVKALCSVPLVSHDKVLGTLDVSRLHEQDFTPAEGELLHQVAHQIAIAVENALAHQEVERLKDTLAKEKLYLEEEIQTEHNFEEIVGESHALKRVLKQVRTVASTDSTVLILGETGSGKELVARALHALSDRKDRTFVKLNCAAIPTGLLESELFGHEKGAFTGAIATKIGRFELADRGTIFLDEVGDIPLELQVKLLRVLQEQEFERLGSSRTIRVNVRVIAATNRDLEQMVGEQKFRGDLYYRLKVFPMTAPPLRERVEDIPLLVRHFTQKFAQRMKKRIETIPAEAMKALQNYPWPGNVRELENFVERAVILTKGQDLFVPVTELKRAAGPAGPSNRSTLEQAEREHILKALRDSNWTIGGPTGAAAKLGVKRTTLQSKMQKLGIARPS
ncbi:MAG: sigma 54-interacting transcriptional regulator [Nitrospirota bacterium]|nr:sigma 54-interacting transcriptional regulator [Nitrospirota bacterium]MDP2382183.1 sigma 54-interacting transcriptional regulator [Nitrospirota bacterium]MDP3595515.1 sigma 54-interacting transcriptional regulator [Nitrospirota bacterium]